MTDYVALADRIIADIRAGKLKPGDRLPPQRRFAYAQGVAASTAARVYAELIRRGVATGEVGRGTFIRLMPARRKPALTEPTSLQIDLDLNFPTVPEQQSLLGASLTHLLQRPDEWKAALAPASARGTPALRGIAAAFLSRPTWQPDPDHLLFAGNGKQAIAATLAAIVPPGERLGVEAMSYPLVRTIAQQLGIRLTPIAMDEEGILPAALAEAHRRSPLRALYLQPTLHNPLGTTMSVRRREQIAAVLVGQGIVAVEDAVYAFLDVKATPVHSIAFEHSVLIDSLSKRLAPGLTLGFIAAPAALRDVIAKTLHTGAWTAPAFAQTACARWMADGTAAKIMDAKRADAGARQKIARRWLGRFDLVSDAKAYHCWLRLPEPWRADGFVTAAARRNIAITHASAFTVSPGHVPNAIRIALSAPPVEVLSDALRELAHILDQGTDVPSPD